MIFKYGCLWGLSLQTAPVLVRFEVLTAVTIKTTIVWDVTPCDLVDGYPPTKLHSITSQKPVILTMSLLPIRRNHNVKRISNLHDLICLELCVNTLYSNDMKNYTFLHY
jgi:hypothetical protein